ncbi:aminotransferase class I/II-fold pyridoxal phosphate-dependent enzyme [Massilia sp. YIM B04103]|uniref:aminotransferase class I/II-fold pyridoxal phosphate-dependent enzyme n=1 Tax=Massilia sp. YIM B04103 TaxID=2963106 RepID=UPI00210E0DFE|nr:aminotransferase class I/II-fold pyridoxal phosphate-dependent enzyme [Massilia sp. YIM B04103]
MNELAGARQLAGEMATLMGLVAAVLLPSTLHLFWDLFGMLGKRGIAVLVDGATYPVARWGVERARCLGAPVHIFPHGAAQVAAQAASYWRNMGRFPVLLADGVTPGRDRPPPLQQYAEIARRYDGLLVLDDTQAVGILGPHGGGSYLAHGLRGAPVIVGASLAKGFGVPLAVLAGERSSIVDFLNRSETRTHSSGVCAAVLAAGGRAMAINRQAGHALRHQLACRVSELRGALKDAGFRSHGGQFPVQVVRLPAAVDGRRFQQLLERAGVSVLLQTSQAGYALAFVVRADMQPGDGILAARALKHYAKEDVWKRLR